MLSEAARSNSEKCDSNEFHNIPSVRANDTDVDQQPIQLRMLVAEKQSTNSGVCSGARRGAAWKESRVVLAGSGYGDERHRTVGARPYRREHPTRRLVLDAGSGETLFAVAFAMALAEMF